MIETGESVEGVLEVRGCPHGRGVFALKDFGVGAAIATVAGGEFLSHPRSKKYALRIGEHLYWDEIPPGEDGYWSNLLDHADEPNCRFVGFGRGRPGADLISVRPISKGDELFLNYREYHPDNPVF